MYTLAISSMIRRIVRACACGMPYIYVCCFSSQKDAGCDLFVFVRRGLGVKSSKRSSTVWCTLCVCGRCREPAFYFKKCSHGITDIKSSTLHILYICILLVVLLYLCSVDNTVYICGIYSILLLHSRDVYPGRTVLDYSLPQNIEES